MIWKRRKKEVEEAQLEAKAAKIQAGIDLSTAYQTKHEVEEQAKRLQKTNSDNHFGQGLTYSSRSKTT